MYMDEIIEEEYQRHNPWWGKREITSSPEYQPLERSDMSYHFDAAREHSVSIIGGQAGIGKTTMLHNIAEQLVAENASKAEEVMYLPLDNPVLRIGQDGAITRAVD